MDKNDEILNALNDIEIKRHPKGYKFFFKKGNTTLIILPFNTSCKCDTCKKMIKQYKDKWFVVSQDEFEDGDFVKVLNDKDKAFNYAIKYLNKNVK